MIAEKHRPSFFLFSLAPAYHIQLCKACSKDLHALSKTDASDADDPRWHLPRNVAVMLPGDMPVLARLARDQLMISKITMQKQCCETFFVHLD